MWSVESFSQGAGPLWLAAGAVASLVVLGIAVRFSRMRPFLGNILVPSSLIVLSLVFLTLTFGFREEEAGPAVVPRLYIFLILVLSGVILWQIFRGREKAVPRLEGRKLLLVTIAAFIGYFLAMPYLGYFLCTFLFIALMLHVLSYRRKALIWVIAGGWVLFSYVLFYRLLFIQLPLGVFERLF